jgi:N-acetyl-gamma-glutamyl-phosphate reductase
MVDVGVFGASGYTGQALLDILLFHPGVKVTLLTSATHRGKRLEEVFPRLAGYSSLTFETPDPVSQSDRAEVFFLCLPHKEAMAVAPTLLGKGKKALDLSADFRLKDAGVYEKWYGAHHSAPELLDKAVYGLPELYAEQIAHAQLIAVPGCYPTSAILGLAPVIGLDWINRKSVVINSVSGVSGAGRKLEPQYMLSELEGNFYAYGAPRHRHTPEIEQELSRLAGESVTVTFIPHLLPVTRGIYTTITADLARPITAEEAVGEYNKFYAGKPFVRVRGGFPQMRWVVERNTCVIGVTVDDRAGRIIITTTIDNLVKGASGQAVQCFNLLHGFGETTGLK